MNKLTKKQNDILRFIVSYMKDYDYSPSYREIADNFNISSPATIHEHIQTLKSKGFLKLNPNMPRSLELTSKVMRMGKSIELPLLGLIAAGVESNIINRPGGIFLRAADQISNEDRI